MLLIMVPLIAAASTQPDFLAMYPKLNDVNSVLENVNNRWLYRLLHELSYGSDFIKPEQRSVNKVLGIGNSLNNLDSVYKDCDFTESYFFRVR